MSSHLEKRITLKDIARRTGFTANTVSKALREKSDLSERTRDLIRKTADEMGYVANDTASALRSGRTKTIAMIVSDISNPFFSIVVKEVESAAQARGYSIIIMNTEEDEQREEQAVRIAIAKNVDGVLLLPTQHNANGVCMLQNAGIPCILMGRYFDGLLCDTVLFDDRRGGYLATDCLLRHGYRRIIMLNAPERISSARERLLGYRDAHAAHGVPVDERFILTVPSAIGHVGDNVKTILNDHPDADAVFAFSDLIAFETICALQNIGWRVPAQIAVVGFDDIQSKLAIPFPLTTICTPKSALAEASLALLLRRIGGDMGDYPVRQVLGAHLVERGSLLL